MDQPAPGIVSDERQRALEQNVFVSASASKVSLDLLLSIDTHLRHIKWAIGALIVLLLIR